MKIVELDEMSIKLNTLAQNLVYEMDKFKI